MKSKCSQKHEEIEFECSCSALCPLCAMRERLTKEKDEVLAKAQTEYMRLVSEAVSNASLQKNALNEQINTLRDTVGVLEKAVKRKETELEQAQAVYLEQINKALADASLQSLALNAKIAELERSRG